MPTRGKTGATAVIIALMVTAARAQIIDQPIDENTVRGARDVTWLIVKAVPWPTPQPPGRPRCEVFLKDPLPNYLEACKEAEAGKPQEALRLLGLPPRDDPAD